jgi:hypothetical protein
MLAEGASNLVIAVQFKIEFGYELTRAICAENI